MSMAPTFTPKCAVPAVYAVPAPRVRVHHGIEFSPTGFFQSSRGSSPRSPTKQKVTTCLAMGVIRPLWGACVLGLLI